MLEVLFEAVWVFGALGSFAFVLYGGGLVWAFQTKSSPAHQRTLARLALDDSQPRADLLARVKAAALVTDAA